jgi:hypothetical protein
MDKGGRVRTAGGAVGDLRGVPWGVVQLDRSAVVTELLEVGAGGVWDGVDVRRQVGPSRTTRGRVYWIGTSLTYLGGLVIKLGLLCV